MGAVAEVALAGLVTALATGLGALPVGRAGAAPSAGARRCSARPPPR